MRQKLLVALTTAALAGSARTPVAAQDAARVAIDHAPVACATVDRFVEIEAKLTPADAIARGRVLFRSSDSEHWYFVALSASKDGRYVAHIPKPQAQLKAFEYYIDAQTRSFEESRTREQRVAVVGRNVTCANGSLAKSAAGVAGRLVVSALGGGPALPLGFASSGVIAGSAAGAATAASGSGAGAGAGAAGAAGGISGTTIAIAGGAVAAAAGVAVATGAVGGDGGDEGSCCHSGTFSIAFTPFIDLSLCGVPGVSQINGGNFSIPSGVKQPQGNFDSTLGSNTQPSPLRVSGFISPTSFNATLACAAGAPNATTISASGTGYNFSGSFTFSGRGGTWTVKEFGK